MMGWGKNKCVILYVFPLFASFHMSLRALEIDVKYGATLHMRSINLDIQTKASALECKNWKIFFW